MKEVFLLAGIGGQGVQALGQMLAHCAAAQGLHVTMDAKYSGNMRGHPSNCTVIISDAEIGSPIEHRCDHLIAFTQQALDKLIDRVNSGGIVCYDSSAVTALPDRSDLRFFGCPAAALAEELGDVRCANSVMAGFLPSQYGFLDGDTLRRCLALVLKKKPLLLDRNQSAFALGCDFGMSAKTE